MAVPKGKVSKQRRNKRRSSVWKLAAPGLVACPKCGALHLPHRMCPECGTYKGREVKVVKSGAADKEFCVLAGGKRGFPLVFLRENGGVRARRPAHICGLVQTGRRGRRPLRSSIDKRCVGATLAVARPMTTAPSCKNPCHCEGAPRPWQSVIPYSPIPIFHSIHKNDSFYFCTGIGYTILRKILASRCKSGYNCIVNMWQYAVFSGETHL